MTRALEHMYTGSDRTRRKARAVAPLGQMYTHSDRTRRKARAVAAVSIRRGGLLLGRRSRRRGPRSCHSAMLNQSPLRIDLFDDEADEADESTEASRSTPSRSPSRSARKTTTMGRYLWLKA